MADSMDTLASKVQKLPQELFDKIYELTFQAASDGVTIDASYKPPSCLQVSKATRTTFAISYYTKARFFSSTDRATQAWMSSLPIRHMRLIRDLRFYDPAVDATSWTMMELDERLFRMAKSKEYLGWIESDWHHVAKFFVRFGHGAEYTWLSSKEVCDACCGINFKHRMRSAADWFEETRHRRANRDL